MISDKHTSVKSPDKTVTISRDNFYGSKQYRSRSSQGSSRKSSHGLGRNSSVKISEQNVGKLLVAAWDDLSRSPSKRRQGQPQGHRQGPQGRGQGRAPHEGLPGQAARGVHGSRDQTTNIVIIIIITFPITTRCYYHYYYCYYY